MAEKTEKPDKAEKAPAKEIPFDQVLGALEQRVEALAGRMRELVAENARLKDSADRLGKLEAEREEVRARIERLLAGLEQAEAGSPEA